MVIMRLMTGLPRLPDGDDNFYSHSTGGEHSTKYIGTEHAYNPIRENGLVLFDESAPEPITHDGLADMLFSDQFEVVFVDRHNVPKDSDTVGGLVGGAIGERALKGRFFKAMNVREIVVHPDARKLHVASYMLGKLTDQEHFGTAGLSEMVLDTTRFVPQAWFLNKLFETGFKHEDESGSPAIWLPGSEVITGRPFDTAEAVQEFHDKMPEGWNGHLDVNPNEDFQTQLFRDGKLLGIARYNNDTQRYDDNDRFVRDYTLYDAGDAELGTSEGVTKNEALTALLNNYELV